VARIRFLSICLLTLLLCLGLAGHARACAGCWAGYGKGDERYNKPLADCRIIYERDGRDAIPYLRKVLQTSTDPLVIKRAAGYIIELNDTGSIPLLEDMVYMLTKRVAFGAFGFGTYEFAGRLAASNALVQFGKSQEVADRIWERYDGLSLDRKTEVAHLLNALQDANLDERLLAILEMKEDHQLMVGALDTLASSGTPAVVPVLEAKVEEWSRADGGNQDNANPEAPVIYYAALRIKAEKAILDIQERNKEASGTSS
jgi:hypothetical protein